ncbi:hypothetical protein AB0K35_11480 [Micromonospora sp. NPDC053740]|uniref:hypothetical protein n=1 Tax=Micromonospora sp. NPDC053740 TaxID=3155173 RepID=UPI00343FAB54
MTDRETSGGLWNLSALITGDAEPSASQAPPASQPSSDLAVPSRPEPASPRSQQQTASPWIPPPPTVASAPSSGLHRRRLMIVVGSAAAVLLALGATVASVNAATDDTSSVMPTAEQPIAPYPTVEPEQTPDYTAPAETTIEETIDPEQAALNALNAQHDQDLPTVSFHGQYAAQLASKTLGISDPYQTNRSGSHIFQATDILEEHQALREGTTDGTAVVLLKSTDYGKRQVYNGEALWVTFALGDFANRDDVLAWCGNRFPQMSGAELGNQCAVRTLAPAP